ncbi:Probable ABC transporter phosphite binding protein PhnD1 [Geodia barretti]|uniref:Probable ABC transporter phosphite binding protein PhnD1 n=1 Tax=Geodia barretti TaxID=519541 RepID=A0AA35SWZ1_GEOBA|nr:Probable ABC transporter phosphite binding protein PhnD1 [Geodia barretti]
MVTLGGSATSSHFEVFQGLEELFRRRGIDLDWILYSDYDAMVDAFVKGDIDLAWNGPLGYVQDQAPAGPAVSRHSDARFEDLLGRRFAFGRRSSEQAGLVPYYVLKQSGLNPDKDLSAVSFYEERESRNTSDERDVVERVASGEFDAGAVSRRTLELMVEDGSLTGHPVRVFWSSPAYSHCCFTAQQDMEPQLVAQIEAAFLVITGSDEVERAVLEGEGCSSFVAGVEEGWEIIEDAAVTEGLV